MLLNSLSPPLRRLQRYWSNNREVRRCLSRYLIFCADTWSLNIWYIARFSGWWICRQWLPVYESSTSSNILRSHPVPTRKSCVSWTFLNDSSRLWALDSNKAVADGAVSFYIDHLVTSRAAKFTYGVGCSTRYHSTRADHLARKNTVYRDLTGRLVVPGVFGSILHKVWYFM